jgi:mono/diheme cytochrome c family protein
MFVVVVLAVVLIFVPLLLWGLNRMRGARAQGTGVSGRGSNNVVGVLFVLVTLGFGIALPLILLHGNEANDSKQVHGVKLTADARSGRELFGEHCAVCHTLSAANAIGKVGPNLDQIHPPKALVLHTIANGCLPNATVKTQNQACLGQGVMPADVVTGKDAQDVASFVAEATGSKGSAGASTSSGTSTANTSSASSSANTSTSSSGGSANTSTSTSTSSSGGSSSGVSLKAGMSVFQSTCAGCHTLAAAGSTGTVGPNLDQLKPNDALVIHQVTNGGGGMPAFGSTLSQTQIKSVALYVSSVAGKPVKGKVKQHNASP